MDIKSLKEQSDLAHQISVEKQTALEKMKSRQTVIYKNRIFKAEPNFINHVKTLIDKNFSVIYVIDSNQNPCEIENPTEFFEILLERNQESIRDYHIYFQKFTKR